jgi:hypothetical protein
MSKNTLGITNLTEAGVAVAALMKSYAAATADGRISLWEWVRIGIGNASEILASLLDAGHVFPELLDLTPLEFEEFYFAVLAELDLENDGSGIARRRIGSVYDLVKQALTTAQQWNDEETPFDGELRDPRAPRAQVIVEESTLAEGERPPFSPSQFTPGT